MDNQIVKAFDKDGNLHKILKINIKNDLSITVKPYNTKLPEHIELWNETFNSSALPVLSFKNCMYSLKIGNN